VTPHASEILRRFVALDQLLQSKGFPATSPWWHRTVRRFYESGRRQLVGRVGRRGGKSSTLCRVAVVEALWGKHVVPPGDLGVVAFISTTRDEANQRIRTIKAILDALGVAYKPCEGGIELLEKPIAFKVYTATVSGVSGFTGICIICDEVAKWKDADTGANPAAEVLASVRPTMATQPEARIILSSSPVGQWDAHYDAFEAGDSEFQVTAVAPTWVANPTVTEAATHTLEPDEAIRNREYGAIPAAEVEEALVTATEVDRSTRTDSPIIEAQEGHVYEAACDPGTRGNAFTLAVATMRMTPLGMRRSIVLAQEWRGSTARPLSPKAVLGEMAPILKPYGIDVLWSDQYSGDALRDLAADVGLSLVPVATTAASKNDMYRNAQTLIRTEQVDLPPDPQVKQDLLGIRRRFTRSGSTIELAKTPDGRHSDHAPSIATVLSKYLPEPDTRAAIAPGTREWEQDMRERRRVAFLAKQDRERRPHWDRRETSDRGAFAPWRK
jgi:hypothetical protein